VTSDYRFETESERERTSKRTVDASKLDALTHANST